MEYRRCGRSGLLLPALSLGCWHNFGAAGSDAMHLSGEAEFHANCRAMLRTAFELGIVHFDLANNYGPPPGAAEERVGRILKEDFGGLRDQLIISSKAGYTMHPGPYGDWGSRKYLIASCEASLRRLQLDYVDVFYHHRPDPQTPLDETMGALETLVRQGKALYIAVSNYSGAQTEAAAGVLGRHDWAPLVLHQPKYSMLNRGVEKDLLPVTHALGIGTIAFCPLAQGVLTSKYLKGIPADSRATHNAFLKEGQITVELVEKVRRLDGLAQRRGQSLAQMALAWTLRPQGESAITSALIGASRPAQLVENAGYENNATFAAAELAEVEDILA